MKNQQRDAIVSVVLMFIISMSIIAAAAGTLYPENLGLTKASQMIELLEPLAGKMAVSIFAIGIIAAGVSSQFPNVLMLPWLLSDYNQSPRNMKLSKYRVMVLLISLLGLVVPIFDARPVFVMIISQAFNAVILPITVACIFYLGNKKEIMGKYSFGVITNIILGVILLFSLFTSFIGVRGVLASLM
jgi:Mn2+/Fe2+ NRAMP family transporter